MSDDSVLNEANRIVSEEASEIEANETLTQLLAKAVPLATLFRFLVGQGISEKTAEKMVLTVWRSWFEQGEGIYRYGETGWGHSIFDLPEGDD